jgi:hypothetical protein
MVIRIKPHHFVDIVTALGAGKTHFEAHSYGHALHRVAEQVRLDPEAVLLLDLGSDDICEPCVHNIRGVCCDTIDTSFRPEAPASKQEWNLLIDQRWCAILGLEHGDGLSVRAFCDLLKRLDGSAIESIYREIPSSMTAERTSNLRRGVNALLAE